jgi:hypothetical protein
MGMEGSMAGVVPVVWIGGEEASEGMGKTSARDDPDEEMSGTAPLSVSTSAVFITTSTPSADSCGSVVAHAASLRDDKPAEATSDRTGWEGIP